MIKSKRIFFQKEKRRVSKEFIKGSSPLLCKNEAQSIEKKREQRGSKKLNFGVDDKKVSGFRCQTFQKVTDWDKVLRKLELKKQNIEDFLWFAPLVSA